MPKSRIAITAACAAALSIPAAADAAVTCSYDQAQKRVDVTASFDGNFANVSRAGTQIRAGGAVCLDGDVPATVTNTDKVVITDTSGGNISVGIDGVNGAFAPGATAEGDGDSEIEFEIVSGGGTADEVLLLGDNGEEHWVLGAVPGGSGANLNAGDEPGAGADIDVTMSGVNLVQATPGDGDDVVSANGPAPFSGPLAVPSDLDGGDDDDILVGGSGADVIEGGHDTDTVSGGAGADMADYQYAAGAVTVDLRTAAPQNTGGDGTDQLTGIERVGGSSGGDTLIGNNGPNLLQGRGGHDVLTGGGGTDELDGGTGADTAGYATAGSGVTVDLAKEEQDTKGAGIDTLLALEHLTGSPFGDLLRGDGANNTLEGGAGTDQLFGFGGADALRVRDGEGDAADCGAGTDSVQTDAPGVDALSGCETVDALPAPVVPEPQGDPQPPQEGGGAIQPAGQPGQPAQPRDTTAPVISALSRRGGRLVLKLSEPARLSVTIARARSRRPNARFRTVRTLNRAGALGTNRVGLPRKLRPGRYRAVVVATDTAGNRSVKRTVTFRVAR